MKPGFLWHAALPVCLGLLMLAAAHRPSPPLVMENADRLEGVRSTGEYVLSGNVRFRHGDLRLETQRALWERVRNRVTCETAMRITHHGSLLTADRGMYDREADRAQAEGNVVMRDSSGEVNATGDRLDYDRVLRVAVLSGNPVARRFYQRRLVYPEGDSTRVPEEKPADTLQTPEAIAAFVSHLEGVNGQRRRLQRRFARAECTDAA